MHPFYYPTDRRSAISELDEAITFYQKMKKELAEEGKKKDMPPKKSSPGDVLGNMLFFTLATPFIGGIYIWLFLYGLKEILSVVQALPK